ncbi:MAG TPA: serine hydrolase domain-containing protein [Gemmatimonadaceae bacterium]|jgi:CubicO group peptidase (beta-lactamase class C family)
MRIELVLPTLVLIAAHATRAQTLDAQIDAYLKGRSGAAFSGVIMVARHGAVVFDRAYGFADADLGIANRTDLRFGIGSLTKPLTATAALRLIERGQLHLADPICMYLRQCPPAWRTVTIEQLLSHTSGLPDLFGELPAASVDSTRVVIDASIARHMADSLRARPGERYAYNNFGYFLVGYAMEVATGRPWASILRTEVLERAGMGDTEYDDVWRVMSRRVRGYAAVHDSLRLIPYHDHAAYAAGGLLSSARDLLRFDVALERGRLLADSSRQVMFTVRRGDYALGWQMITAFGERLRNHSGGTNGFSSWLGHFDDGTVIILLSNIEDVPAKAIGCDVAAITFGLKPSPRDADHVACRAER